MLTTADGIRRTAADSVRATRTWEVPRDLVVFRPFAKPRSANRDRARRALNVLVALIGLVLLAPLMLLIAVLIKLSSPGPVFYSQTRVGVDRRSTTGGNFRRRIDYGGKLFTIYKFRTMRVAAPDASQVWATKEDPRITPVGRVLRKTRLDELPQLINVLRGEMNVVGPRPEQPNIFLQLREQIDRYQERQRVLPGITGWAQVNQAYDTTIDDVKNKVALDLEYAQRRSVSEDLRIMVKTIPVMVMRNYGQ